MVLCFTTPSTMPRGSYSDRLETNNRKKSDFRTSYSVSHRIFESGHYSLANGFATAVKIFYQ